MDDEHPNNVIDRALHLLQGEANAAAEGMKDVAQRLSYVIGVASRLSYDCVR